jgi:1-acyl-sn-glycerol-3-phosphate acyltransferase
MVMASHAWTYQPAPDLGRPLADRLLTVPRSPDLLLYALRTSGTCLVRMWLATYFRFRVRGRENLPAGGSFVMVANHSSHLDALCLLAALPIGRIHTAYPAAAADYFFKNVPLGILSGLFMNALPFSRKGKVRQTLESCRQILAGEGNALILFPEGTRTTSGQMNAFKGGVGELVAGTNIPVVPCYLDGAFVAWPKGRVLPMPRRVTLTIGKPLRFAHLVRNRPNCDRIAEELERAVRELGTTTRGQETER